MNIFKENKIFTSFYLIWLFVHFFLYIKAYDYCRYWDKEYRLGRYLCSDYFYPFQRFNQFAYDFTELFVYVLFPLIMFIIFKLFFDSKQ